MWRGENEDGQDECENHRRRGVQSAETGTGEEVRRRDRHRTRRDAGRLAGRTGVPRVRRIRNRGARITFSVVLGNVAAEAFYRQLGFAEIAKVVEMAFESV